MLFLTKKQQVVAVFDALTCNRNVCRWLRATIGTLKRNKSFFKAFWQTVLARPQASSKPLPRSTAANGWLACIRHLATNTQDTQAKNTPWRAGWLVTSWRGWRGSNPRPLASEANTLSTELQPRDCTVVQLIANAEPRGALLPSPQGLHCMGTKALLLRLAHCLNGTALAAWQIVLPMYLTRVPAQARHTTCEQPHFHVGFTSLFARLFSAFFCVRPSASCRQPAGADWRMRCDEMRAASVPPCVCRAAFCPA